MNARAIIDAIKKETGINTDRSLAEEMGIKYPTFANWITRNSLQYDVIIPFCESKGVDMNQIFGEGIYNAATAGSDDPISTKFKEKMSFYQENGGKLIIDPFLVELQELYSKYDDKVDTIKKALS